MLKPSGFAESTNLIFQKLKCNPISGETVPLMYTDYLLLGYADNVFAADLDCPLSLIFMDTVRVYVCVLKKKIQGLACISAVLCTQKIRHFNHLFFS
jgi:hypothetical protein